MGRRGRVKHDWTYSSSSLEILHLKFSFPLCLREQTFFQSLWVCSGFLIKHCRGCATDSPARSADLGQAVPPAFCRRLRSCNYLSSKIPYGFLCRLGDPLWSHPASIWPGVVSGRTVLLLPAFRVGYSVSFTGCVGCADLRRAIEQHEDGCMTCWMNFFRLLDFSSLILSCLNNISLIVLL